MATRTHTPDVIKPVTGDLDKHPRGLYVLFATEMWERFGFYTIGGMFALYLRDTHEGFAFSAAQASTLYANYLSPMGLSLVSKVAPLRLRGFMMGGWFFATAMGNKLTQIAVFWTVWKHSTFWIVLSGLALIMAVVLLILLRPLKKAMPGV
jgi:proton-dependent oligopeptide transporter, POT family